MTELGEALSQLRFLQADGGENRPALIGPGARHVIVAGIAGAAAVGAGVPRAAPWWMLAAAATSIVSEISSRGRR